MPDEMITIPLPSLIHRIGSEQAKKARYQAKHHHCMLSRVRRSRNWQIKGLAIHLSEFCKHIQLTEPESMAFVIGKLEQQLAKHLDKLEPKEQKLRRIIGNNPDITLSELTALTNCSISEARKARFDSEIL